jgi:transposase InsO family protein
MWAVDFQHDQTADGRMLRLVNVVDEFTREALVMHADRSIGADGLVAQLDTLVARRGRPAKFLRSDNGTELTGHALRDWWRFSQTDSAFIEPGAPWQNPFVESFHARVRDELLNVEQFASAASNTSGCARPVPYSTQSPEATSAAASAAEMRFARVPLDPPSATDAMGGPLRYGIVLGRCATLSEPRCRCAKHFAVRRRARSPPR